MSQGEEECPQRDVIEPAREQTEIGAKVTARLVQRVSAAVTQLWLKRHMFLRYTWLLNHIEFSSGTKLKFSEAWAKQPQWVSRT